MPDSHEIAEHHKERVSQLIARAKELKKALKYYANDDIYELGGVCEACEDRGKTAREALNAKE